MTGDSLFGRTDCVAWTEAPKLDFALVFVEDVEGPHAMILADGVEDPAELAGELDGYLIRDSGVDVFCTDEGECARAFEVLIVGGRSSAGTVIGGRIELIEPGYDPPKLEDHSEKRRAHLVYSRGGEAPRRYRGLTHCGDCGERRGLGHLDRGGDVAVACWCRSIPCRYCDGGRVRRPGTDHIDTHGLAWYTPWYGYLVPCADCEAAGRGPTVRRAVSVSAEVD